MPHFRVHTKKNPSCKIRLPYGCQFCDYIECEITGLQKYIKLKPSREHIYKEKEVATGLIPDLSTDEIVTNIWTPHIS